MSPDEAKQALTTFYAQGERDFRGFGSSLRDADLSGIMLEACNLSGLDLSGANLSKANLSNSDLSRTNLSYATLSGATMTRATLCSTNLTGADATNVEMRFCLMAEANLSGTTFIGGHLEPSIFTKATYNASTTFPEGFDPTNKGMVKGSLSTPKRKSRSERPSSTTQVKTSKPPSKPSGDATVQAQPVSVNLNSATPSTSTPDSGQPPKTSDPAAQSEQSSQADQNEPKKRKILFRGRWVEM